MFDWLELRGGPFDGMEVPVYTDQDAMEWYTTLFDDTERLLAPRLVRYCREDGHMIFVGYIEEAA